MKKVEALTLKDAYTKASTLLDCSISDLECEVIQYPSNGILGFMKKNAIIVASSTKVLVSEIVKEVEKEIKKEVTKVSIPEEVEEKQEVKPKIEEEKQEVEEKKEIVLEKKETIVKKEVIVKDAVLDAFFEKETTDVIVEEKYEEENIVYDELALLIENQIKELLAQLCFNIDVVEVDVRDNTALIFIDGEDAALLIGKEGYRYNALSYMLFNWLHGKYELFIKLEIAEFLTKQQEMIASYIKPVIETVEKNGKGRTHFLDGILVQIALEQLRERFPDKYIAIKTGKEGKKFVVINAFNSPHKPKK
ncbi:RNA-binding protein Jag [hydrothermal vent metagenome]|uniref:RNA-binding protein Jag n=1 Tax=hydrothermal vent metagenome TaxID=652676 RepID=A0A1W1BML0_9ZZZZ